MRAVKRPAARSPRAVPARSDAALRIATALLMTIAAGLILVHAQVYAAGAANTPQVLKWRALSCIGPNC